MMATFRRMQIADIIDVMAIDKVSQPVSWSEQIFHDCLKAGYEAWILDDAGMIIGYILATMQAGECHILNVTVKPEFQQQGYGRLLMEKILRDARERKIESAFLEVRPSNTVAITLYRNLGFNEIGMRKEYYPQVDGKREDALIFAIQL